MEIKKINNQKGFTLVELIVVIAILGILAAVAVPNYTNYQRRSRINTDASSAAEIVRAARSSYLETGKKPSGLPEDVKDMKPISGKDPFTLNTSNADAFSVSWTADADLTGKYAGGYTYTEGGELPTPKDGGNSSTTGGTTGDAS